MSELPHECGDEDYADDDWETQDTRKQSGVVCPLPVNDGIYHTESMVCGSETQSSVSGSSTEDKTKDYKTQSHTKANVDSESKVDEDYAEPSPRNQHTKSRLDDLAKVHAHRISTVTRPHFSSQDEPVSCKKVEIAGIGAMAAIEAAHRVRSFRHQKAEEFKQEQVVKANIARQRQMTRLSNKSFNRTIGIADCTPQEFLREWKRKNKVTGNKEQDERGPRWYNNIQRQARYGPVSADHGAKMLETARREYHAQLLRKMKHQRSIDAKLQRLSVEAKQIISKATGRYIRGSYILKETNNDHKPSHSGKVNGHV